MTDRKPDFYVVKREGLDGAPEWFTYEADGHVWDYQLTLRHRFVTEADAAKIAKKYTGRVIPVYCTSKRAEPKMRERSPSWVLKRLAEGKVVVSKSNDNTDFFYRFNQSALCIEVEYGSGWERSAQMVCFDRTTKAMLCRLARPSEVPQ